MTTRTKVQKDEKVLDQISITQLTKQHARKVFDCGDPSLNSYLKKLSFQHENKNLSRTYVATPPSSSQVVGYYSIATAHVDHNKVSLEHFPHHPKGIPLPCAIIGRLAVDLKYQKIGLGEYLLLHAFNTAVTASDKIGINAILVRALNAAKAFYEKYGFLEIEKVDDNKCDLIIGMKAVKKVLNDSIV